MILPILITLLMGMFDLGFGISLNQKTITSSQIASDLISRNKSVDLSDVNNIINASKVTFEPYNLSGYGIDIVSIEFDENGDPQFYGVRQETCLPMIQPLTVQQDLAPKEREW